MFNQHDLYDGKDNASFEQRLMAFILDATIIATLVSFATNIGGPTSFLGILYYIIFQCMLGYTPGKYVLGLRVISTTGKTSFFKMFLREFVGRTLSALPLGLGYLSIMFSNSRLAWHDRISSTRVISLRPVEVAVPMQVLRGLGSLALIISLIGGGGYYTVLHTSLPLQKFASRLNVSGIQLSGISGSFSSGFNVKKLSFESDERSVELNNIRFLVNKDKKGLDKISFKESPTFDEVFINGGHVRLKSITDVASAAVKKEPELQDEIDKPKSPRSYKGVLNLWAKKVEIQNIEFSSDEKTFNLDRFSISNLNVTDDLISVEHIYTSSPDFDLLLKDTLFKRNSNEGKFTLKTMLKPNNPWIQGLKRKVSISADLVHDGTTTTGEVEGFAKTIKISKTKSKTSVQLKNFQPNAFFKDKTPIRKIDLSTVGKNIVGQIKIRNRKFNINKQNPVLALMAGLTATDSRGYELKIYPMRMMGIDAWAKIKTLDGKLRRLEPEILSQVYLNRPLNTLSTEHKVSLNKDSQFFSSGPFKNIGKKYLGKYMEKMNRRQP
ncbi:MAG: RDD family protein, partial [Bdellovibrionales bacterium]|nr:RDD family protein [Bdellovibrionales bacterium]NQZ19795.1 RDD family protein [Bdellovibrionales bacterium]